MVEKPQPKPEYKKVTFAQAANVTPQADQNLANMEGEIIDIVSYKTETRKGDNGEYLVAFIIQANGKTIFTSSGVVIEQLNTMKFVLDGKHSVSAKIVKPTGKRYYTLVDPDQDST